MDKKTSSLEIKKSIMVKSLSLMILLSISVLVGLESVSYCYMNIYEKRTMENYQNSLQSYCSYWDKRLETINSSILTYTGVGNNDGLFWEVCYSQNELTFQTDKTLLVRQMSDLAWNHENKILVFCCIPSRDVFLKSTNHLVEYQDRKKLDDDIKSYIENRMKSNSGQWEFFQSGEKDFFIQVYKSNEGYVGALVKTDTIFDEIEQESDIINGIELTDENGEMTRVISERSDTGQKDLEIRIMIPFQCLDGQLCVTIRQKSLFSDKWFMTVLSLSTIMAGFLLLVWNVRFQVKNVLVPLNKLYRIMEDFSHGDMNVRLKESDTKNEIGVLYRAFNEMAEQIVHLKIDMYEQKLEREKIESNYLRVQIQPHFYTNVLNLIYGLAQLKNFGAIQELSMTTGAYFRYLLGEKGTFVLLREEIECVRNYFQIQKIRYKDSIEFVLDLEPGLEGQMVLPMILQTFAGNSVKHNITLVPVLCVSINIYSEKSMLYILIRDNGVGFEPEILSRINRNESIGTNGTHIGIMNVKERIRLFYGDKASVEIKSKYGQTEVRVVLSEVVSAEEEDEYYTGR